jgi:hypothetical protein
LGGDVAGESGPHALDHAGWECGDFSSADWADQEIEYAIAEGPAPGHWRGLTEMAVGVRE